MRKLTKDEINKIDGVHSYFVVLTRLYEPHPVTKYTGMVTFHIQRRPNNDIGVLAIRNMNWAEYGIEDIEEDGSCVCEDYLMEIFV